MLRRNAIYGGNRPRLSALTDRSHHRRPRVSDARRQLRPALTMLLVFTVISVYPLLP